MAQALTEITGIRFRLAASGSQFGSDGSGTNEEDGVSFECKRYEGRIPRSEILSKIADVSINARHVEVWFLCATSEVPAQLARDVHKLAQEVGVATRILDWSGDLPPLAVALAISTAVAERFLPPPALAALEDAKAHRHFRARAEALRSDLLEPLVGIAAARRANTKWLTAALSDRRQALLSFGEPLSPLDATPGVARTRDELVGQFQSFVTVNSATILCVLGGEGVGKSWLVAQAAFSIEHRPLLVLMRPRDLHGVGTVDDFRKLLASTLARQTGGELTDIVVKGWQKKLTRWRYGDRPSRPRLMAVIDGLNQRPETNWSRVIELAADELSKISGLLIVTSRSSYYKSHVQHGLVTAVESMNVPQWTEAERDDILASRGLDPSVLYGDGEARSTVARSLRNPRLLGIALGLFRGRTIDTIEDLNVSYLLFEHIRAAQQEGQTAEPAHETVKRLRTHAAEVVSRIKQGAADDLAVFSDAQVVADGRFFVPVGGDPTRYTLEEDGLVLALAFAVIDTLRIADRNRRDVGAALESIMEPIVAFDQAAKVVTAAVTCACLDQNLKDEIVVALLIGFVELQNSNQQEFGTLNFLARKRVQAFMEAARRICLSGRWQANADWIEEALLLANRGDTWPQMAEELRAWMGCYSLSAQPIRRSLPPPKIQDKQAEIDHNLESLATAERHMLTEMKRSDGDLSELSRLAFALVAGRPLAPFARNLVQWCLANLLNQAHCPPYEHLEYLVRLNPCDWAETRTALLREGQVFQLPGASRTGQWALVVLLRATGHPEDARTAAELTGTLSDFEPRSWRLVEQYCAADPCDPSSSRPDNVLATARRYDDVEVASLWCSTGQSGHDLFFDMARTGVARFEPKAAVRKHRKLADDVLARSGRALRQGLCGLRPHSALVTYDMARRLIVENSGAMAGSVADGGRGRDGRISAQYRLLIAFPMLGGREQVEALLAAVTNEDFTSSLSSLLKPLTPTDFEGYLRDACSRDVEREQYALLAFARGSGTKLSARSRKMVAKLMTSESDRVRMLALAITFDSRDLELVRRLVDSEWRADLAPRRYAYEGVYGSAILVEGVCQSLLSVDAALDRISPRVYGWMAKRLSAVGERRQVALRVDAALHVAVGTKRDFQAPGIECHSRSDCRPEPEHCGKGSLL